MAEQSSTSSKRMLEAPEVEASPMERRMGSSTCSRSALSITSSISDTLCRTHNTCSTAACIYMTCVSSTATQSASGFFSLCAQGQHDRPSAAQVAQLWTAKHCQRVVFITVV